MATRVDLIFREGNDETIRMTIVPDDLAENMLLVSSLRTYVKASACDSDTDVNTLVLTTANPAQMVIVSHTVGQLVAEAYVPAASLVRAFDRTWRVDAHVGSTHRTAMYGNVSVVDL